MATYNWNQVNDFLLKNGLYMDDAEKRRLAGDPDRAMSVANEKLIFKNAATTEEREAANKRAEGLRAMSGYSMGNDGKTYSLVDSPSSFVSDYTKEKGDTYDAVKNYGDFSYNEPAPQWNDTYADKRAELLDAIANPGKFSYEYESDPVYKSFAKQYRREGDRAVQNAVAQTAANTGGMASSYSSTAAAQAGNYYGAALADKIPELYDAAYNRWLAELQAKQNALAAYQGETDSAFSRYLNQRNIYEGDRNFQYGVYNDKYSRLQNALSNATALEESDYSRHNDTLSYLDSLKAQRLEDAYEAGTVLGDTRKLSELGYDTSYLDEQIAMARDEAKTAEEQEALDRAVALWEVSGDPSALEAMGVDMSYAKNMRDANLTSAKLSNDAAYKQLYGNTGTGGTALTQELMDAYKRVSNGTATDADYLMLANSGMFDTGDILSMSTHDPNAVTEADYTQAAQIISGLVGATWDSGIEKYQKSPGVDAIAGMLKSGDTSYADLLYGVAPELASKLFPGYVNNAADPAYTEVADIAKGNEQNGNPLTAGMTTVQKTVYYAYMNTNFDEYNGVIPREDWNIAKEFGNSSSAIKDYASYDEYLADYNALMAAYGG